MIRITATVKGEPVPRRLFELRFNPQNELYAIILERKDGKGGSWSPEDVSLIVDGLSLERNKND